MNPIDIQLAAKRAAKKAVDKLLDPLASLRKHEGKLVKLHPSHPDIPSVRREIANMSDLYESKVNRDAPSQIGKMQDYVKQMPRSVREPASHDKALHERYGALSDEHDRLSATNSKHWRLPVIQSELAGLRKHIHPEDAPDKQADIFAKMFTDNGGKPEDLRKKKLSAIQQRVIELSQSERRKKTTGIAATAGGVATAGYGGLLLRGVRNPSVGISYGASKGGPVGHKVLAEDTAAILKKHGIKSTLYNADAEGIRNLARNTGKHVASINTGFGVSAPLSRGVKMSKKSDYSHPDEPAFPVTPESVSRSTAKPGKISIGVHGGGSGYDVEAKIPHLIHVAGHDNVESVHLYAGHSHENVRKGLAEYAKTNPKSASKFVVHGMLPREEAVSRIASHHINVATAGSSTLHDVGTSENPSVFWHAGDNDWRNTKPKAVQSAGTPDPHITKNHEWAEARGHAHVKTNNQAVEHLTKLVSDPSYYEQAKAKQGSAAQKIVDSGAKTREGFVGMIKGEMKTGIRNRKIAAAVAIPAGIAAAGYGISRLRKKDHNMSAIKQRFIELLAKDDDLQMKRSILRITQPANTAAGYVTSGVLGAVAGNAVGTVASMGKSSLKSTIPKIVTKAHKWGIRGAAVGAAAGLVAHHYISQPVNRKLQEEEMRTGGSLRNNLKQTGNNLKVPAAAIGVTIGASLLLKKRFKGISGHFARQAGPDAARFRSAITAHHEGWESIARMSKESKHPGERELARVAANRYRKRHGLDVKELEAIRKELIELAQGDRAIPVIRAIRAKAGKAITPFEQAVAKKELIPSMRMSHAKSNHVSDEMAERSLNDPGMRAVGASRLRSQREHLAQEVRNYRNANKPNWMSAIQQELIELADLRPRNVLGEFSGEGVPNPHAMAITYRLKQAAGSLNRHKALTVGHSDNGRPDNPISER